MSTTNGSVGLVWLGLYWRRRRGGSSGRRATGNPRLGAGRRSKAGGALARGRRPDSTTLVLSSLPRCTGALHTRTVQHWIVPTNLSNCPRQLFLTARPQIASMPWPITSVGSPWIARQPGGPLVNPILFTPCRRGIRLTKTHP